MWRVAGRVIIAAMKIVKDKIDQACGILDEMNIDMWLIFVRETPMQADPTLAMVVGFDCTWQSFFMYTRQGDAVALVGQFDADNYERSGCFTEVVPYSRSVKEDYLKLCKIQY